MSERLKKRSTQLIFLGCVIFIMALSFLWEKNHIGHDLLFHAYRIIGIKEAILDHQFLPKIYPYANNGYGHASSLFYCDLFLYPFALLHYWRLPFMLCYRMAVVFYIAVAAVSIFYVAKKIFKQAYSPYVACILYIFSNYYLYDVYARSAFGEVLACAFIPWIFYGMYRLFIQEKQSILLLGTSFALLAMSHVISLTFYSFFFALSCVVYLVKERFQKTKIMWLLQQAMGAALLAGVLSVWYLGPMVEQFLDQRFFASTLNTLYSLSDTRFSWFSVFNPLAMIDTPKHDIFHWIGAGGFVLLLQLLYSKVHKRGVVNYLLILVGLGLLAGLEIIPLLHSSLFSYMQFYFRLYLLLYPILTFTSVYIIENLTQKLQKTIILFLCFFSLGNALLIQFSPYVLYKNDKQAWVSYKEDRKTLYDPAKLNGAYDHNHLEIASPWYLPVTRVVNYLEDTTFIKRVNADGQYEDVVYEYERSFSNISFRYESAKKELIMLPLTYYKGYQAYAWNQKTQAWEKLATINVPEYKKVGLYTQPSYIDYRVRYVGTPLQKVSLFMSGVAWALVIFYRVRTAEQEEFI